MRDFWFSGNKLKKVKGKNVLQCQISMFVKTSQKQTNKNISLSFVDFGATTLPCFLLLSSKPSSPDASSPTTQSAQPEHIPLSRVSSASRSYDLQERRRTGNMTGAEQAKYQRIPTDESEAQTLASADLDGIKSE